MKIRVPKYALEHNLNDHELVFSCFMGYIGRQGAKTTRFYMYSEDIKHMLGHVRPHPSENRKSIIEYKNQTQACEDYLKNINKVFRVAMIDYYTWGIEFDMPDEYWYKNGHIIFDEAEITDIEAIKIYYYLAGRCSDNNIFTETEERIIPTSVARRSSKLDIFFRDHFML